MFRIQCASGETDARATQVCLCVAYSDLKKTN